MEEEEGIGEDHERENILFSQSHFIFLTYSLFFPQCLVDVEDEVEAVGSDRLGQ